MKSALNIFQQNLEKLLSKAKTLKGSKEQTIRRFQQKSKKNTKIRGTLHKSYSIIFNKMTQN